MSDAARDGLRAVLERRRLSVGGAERRRFRVSRQAALERLRTRPLADPWDWTQALVRAAKSSSPSAAARVRQYASPTDPEVVVTELAFVVPGAVFERGAFDDLLGAALGVDEDTGQAPIRGGAAEATAGAKQARQWRRLVGEAVNLALGQRPRAVEVRSPAGGVAFVPDELGRVVAGRPLTPEGDQSFVVRVASARPGLGTRVGEWIAGKDELALRLARRWSSWIVGAAAPQTFDLGQGMPLGAQHAQFELELGAHARLGWTPDAAGAPLDEGLWLVRDGVRMADLAPTLAAANLEGGFLRGWVDCPRLQLTADEGKVVNDAACELLIAWLREYCERARAEGSHAVHWPLVIDEIEMVSGRRCPRAELEARGAAGHELVYVWPHHAPAVPQRFAARIARLHPSQVEGLQRDVPGLRLLALRALGSTAHFEPTDLSSLAQGSLATTCLARGAALHLALAGQPRTLRLDLVAYVHRYPHATAGTVVVSAFGRRVAQLRDPAFTLPGVTLLCDVTADEVEALDVEALRQDPAATLHIATRGHELAHAHREDLLSHVMGQRSPWDVPFLRVSVDELHGTTIELRYVHTPEGLRLAWRDTVLLSAPVATTMNGEPRTLRDALDRLREVGWIVLGEPDARWRTLESTDPELAPWACVAGGRELLERVVGPAALLQMPAVPETRLLVRDAARQRHLLRSAALVTQDLARADRDPEARGRLVGHLLVARALADNSQGLETVPLFLRYDPRALAPSRWVSLEAILDEIPAPGLVPLGTVNRRLATPVIEAAPGVARLLAAEGLAPASLGEPEHVASGSATRSLVAPIRKRARAVRPLLHRSFVHPLAVGSLHVAGDGSSSGIALWSQGLRVGEVELPEPLGRVSGRLWLTASGQRASRVQLHATVLALARDLVGGALAERALLSPSGKRRQRLAHFINYARGVVLADDPHALAPLLGLAPRELGDPNRDPAHLFELSLRTSPLQPLPEAPAARLASLLRQSLATTLHVEAAALSWRVLEVQGRRDDGTFRVDLGRRNEWVQAALRGDPRADVRTATLAIAHFHRDLAAKRLVELPTAHRVVAFLRLLALLRATPST